VEEAVRGRGLVRAAIQLITLGQDFLSLYNIHRCIISAPADARDPHRPSWQKDSFCHRLLVQARQRVARCGHPLAQHDLRMTEDYFLRFWAALNPRTKTTVVSVFQAFASPFLYDELFQRCCTGVSIDPRATHRGKLIVMARNMARMALWLFGVRIVEHRDVEVDLSPAPAVLGDPEPASDAPGPHDGASGARCEGYRIYSTRRVSRLWNASGLASGWGLDRLLMLAKGIDDAMVVEEVRLLEKTKVAV
jgi:hypothetical protein